MSWLTSGLQAYDYDINSHNCLRSVRFPSDPSSLWYGDSPLSLPALLPQTFCVVNKHRGLCLCRGWTYAHTRYSQAEGTMGCSFLG